MHCCYHVPILITIQYQYLYCPNCIVGVLLYMLTKVRKCETDLYIENEFINICLKFYLLMMRQTFFNISEKSKILISKSIKSVILILKSHIV